MQDVENTPNIVSIKVSEKAKEQIEDLQSKLKRLHGRKFTQPEIVDLWLGAYCAASEPGNRESVGQERKYYARRDEQLIGLFLQIEKRSPKAAAALRLLAAEIAARGIVDAELETAADSALARSHDAEQEAKELLGQNPSLNTGTGNP